VNAPIQPLNTFVVIYVLTFVVDVLWSAESTSTVQGNCTSCQVPPSTAWKSLLSDESPCALRSMGRWDMSQVAALCAHASDCVSAA